MRRVAELAIDLGQFKFSFELVLFCDVCDDVYVTLGQTLVNGTNGNHGILNNLIVI